MIRINSKYHALSWETQGDLAYLPPPPHHVPHPPSGSVFQPLQPCFPPQDPCTCFLSARMLWLALSHHWPLWPNVTSLPCLCEGASPPPHYLCFIHLIIFISNWNYLTYSFTCVFCLFLNPGIRTPGGKGLCLECSRYLTCTDIYKDGKWPY